MMFNIQIKLNLQVYTFPEKMSLYYSFLMIFIKKDVKNKDFHYIAEMF